MSIEATPSKSNRSLPLKIARHVVSVQNFGRENQTSTNHVVALSPKEFSASTPDQKEGREKGDSEVIGSPSTHLTFKIDQEDQGQGPGVPRMVPSFQAYLPWGLLVASCTHSFLKASHTHCVPTPPPPPEGPIIQLRIIRKWVLAEERSSLSVDSGCPILGGRGGLGLASDVQSSVDKDAPVYRHYFCSLPRSSVLWPVREPLFPLFFCF